MKIRVKLSVQKNANFFGVRSGDIVELNWEDYIAGVVASEIGNAPLEACKAQAIAARTFSYPYLSKGKAISDQSSSAQCFRAERMNSPSYPNSTLAVNDTAGVVLFYEGKVIDTCPYSASNGGKTISSEERWGGHRKWLPEKNDPWDLAATGGEKRGHGVGMSQEGAKYAAANGYTYEEIIEFYYTGCEMKCIGGAAMSNEKVEKVKQWAQARVGNPYVYGGTGKECTVDYRQQRAEQYPDSAALIEKNCQRMSGGKSSCSGCKWYDAEQKKGKQCYDCAQFTRWAMDEIGISFPSGATSQWTKVDWAEKGTINQQPKKLCIVYRQDKDGTMGHTGISLGDGTVIDARGTNYGVLHQTVEKYGRWTHWGIPEGLYEEQKEEATGGDTVTAIAKVIGGTLRLRASASTASAIRCGIPEGTILNVLEKGDEWCKVDYNGKKGYVMSRYLAFDGEEKFDIVISCATEAERNTLLAQLHNAKIM